MSLKFIDIINSISCFQLVVFSIFLIHKGRKNISNIILTIFFIAQFIVILDFMLMNINGFKGNFYVYIANIHYPFQYVWGPSLFFYVKSKLTENFKFKLFDLLHLVPFVFSTGFILFGYYFKDFETKNTILINQSLIYWMNLLVIPYVLLLHSYTISGLILIYRFERNLKNYYSLVDRKDLQWLKFVVYCYITTCIIASIPEFGRHIIPISWDKVQMGLYIPFLLFFNLLFYKAMISPYVIIVPEKKLKTPGLKLDEQEIQDYAKHIEGYLKEHKPFLNQSLTLSNLAERTGLSERIISQTINTHWNQNFFSFINSYRIEETKNLLISLPQNATTMEGIAFDAGFNSRSVFYEAFKRHTGMTPKEYRRLNK